MNFDIATWTIGTKDGAVYVEVRDGTRFILEGTLCSADARQLGQLFIDAAAKHDHHDGHVSEDYRPDEDIPQCPHCEQRYDLTGGCDGDEPRCHEIRIEEEQ